MGLVNWLGNKAQSGARNITLSARSTVGLDSEISKYEAKGYVRVGQPYTAREGGVYGPMVYYQSMTTTNEISSEIQQNNTKTSAAVIAILIGVAFPPIGIIELIAYLIYKSNKNGDNNEQQKNL